MAVERLRKVLSGNTEADINLEYLVEDYDLNGTMTREQFESMNSDLLDKIR
eukprot:CAMPEP_0168314834 /NCGR_PEP_ID=MMETSP0210-20121227/9559_1 /TAXON_ID=40633 /ORGANISM="Condylostoma magnum, Strain COL2" /LENGTH=50 /DNA_ID=CAMNT_0008285231 /DNA_START=807 /DNA_END=959 /DNA_ORIENTATION=+